VSASGGDGSSSQGGGSRPTQPDGAANGSAAAGVTDLVVRRAPPGPPLTSAGTTAAAVPRTPRGLASPEQLESFRELRTRLLAMAEGVKLPRFTTLVVPVSPGSGASFVARNLAIAFTLQEQRVAILVDCNVRHPTQHASLGQRPDDVGLFDYLEQPRSAIDKLVRATSIPGLHLIPAGRAPSVSREYFSSQPMRMVMAALRQSPCYPFLDGPPAKGSPDARILSQLADFVVLVAGYGKDTPAAIAQAAALFEPSKLAGVVFNERV
jgi:protein-tyrosine kinase